MSFSVDLIQDVSVFADQAVSWDRLAARFANPLLSHDWFLSCAEAFSNARDLHIVRVHDNGRLVAAAPLVVAKFGFVDRLEMLGASVLHEPTGFLYDSDDSLRALCHGVVALSRPLWLRRVPGDEPIRAALATATTGRGLLMQSSGGECPFLLSPASWDEYLKSRSSQRRYDLRRARRRLQEQGAMKFLCLAPGPDEVDTLLESAFAIESSGWKGRAGSAILHRPELREFFSRYARRACDAGQLRLCFLMLDGRPLAVEIAVEASESFWVLKVGYEERWANCSPGLQLMAECIRLTMERGIRTHEFLGSAEAWIQPWASGTRSYHSFRYYPWHWRGLMAWVLDQADRFGSKFVAVTKSVKRDKVRRNQRLNGRPGLFAVQGGDARMLCAQYSTPLT